MFLPMLIVCLFALALGLGLSLTYVMCFPSCHFSIERQPSAPSPYDFTDALKCVDLENFSSEYEARSMVELYQRLNENRRLYQASKEDYENTIGKSKLLYCFIPLLIAPLLPLRSLKIYGFIIAGVYIGSFIIGCRIFRKKNPRVMEKDCPPEPAPPAEINTPRAFVDYWARVERVQQSAVFSRCSMVSDMKSKVSEATTFLIFALAICAVLSFLSLGTVKYTAEELAYCQEESYADGYAAGKEDGYEDGERDSRRAFDDYLLIEREDYEYSCSVINQLYNILEENWEKKYFSIEEFYGYLTNYSLNVRELD